MRDILKEFRDFRRDADLPYNPDFVPRSFDSMAELDHGYHQNEIRAEAAEAKAQQQLAMVRKSAECDDYVTADAVDFAFQSMAAQIRDEAVIPLRKEIAALRSELAELKAAPGYQGTWVQGTKYLARSTATHDGSCWHANQDTTAKPGTSPAWSLMVKRGRDGKDASK
jgi:hypothetical protein